MTRLTKTLGGVAFVALASAAAAPMVQAQGNDDPAEAQAFLASGMTLTEAASAAEANSGGTAMSASWEPQSSGAMAFEVELAQDDGTVTTVFVDPSNGAVTAVTANDDDGVEGDDDDSDQDDEDGVEGDDED